MSDAKAGGTATVDRRGDEVVLVLPFDTNKTLIATMSPDMAIELANNILAVAATFEREMCALIWTNDGPGFLFCMLEKGHDGPHRARRLFKNKIVMWSGSQSEPSTECDCPDLLRGEGGAP